MTYKTPRGNEIKEYELFVGDFTIEDILKGKSYMDEEDLYTREGWLEAVEEGHFIPYDGTVGEIFIDGKLTNYRLVGWTPDLYLTFGEEKVYFGVLPDGEVHREDPLTVEEFKALEGKIQLLWYNR